MKKLAIFSSCEIHPIGGPSGYLYNLTKALSNLDSCIKFIFPAQQPYSLFQIVFRLLCSCIPSKNLRHKVRRYIQLRHIANCINKSSKSDFFMCHSCQDLNLLDRLWKDGFIKYKKPYFILMSHSPTLPSEELQESAHYQGNYIDFNALKLNDIAAFESANLIVSPSKNAMNSYYKDIPQILNTKQFYYITTGCQALKKHDKNEMREKFNIRTPFVICYVGRHWKIKGYDSIKIIAEKLLSERNDVTFLIAGKQNPTLPPLIHPRWIELGWANSAEVFSCADIFLLPSRESYFDLVIPEALSVGLKCILSNVGGNIDFHEICPEIDIFSSNEEAIKAIHSYLSLSLSVRSEISSRLIDCYYNVFSEQQFAERYIEFSNQLPRLRCE